MTELPRSLPEFEARFPDEAACARWLLEKRWPGTGSAARLVAMTRPGSWAASG